MAYAPLEYLRNGLGELPGGLTYRPGHLWEDFYPIILPVCLGMKSNELEGIREWELLEYVLRRKFLTRHQNLKKEHRKWDKNVRRFIPLMLSELGYHSSNFPGSVSVISEVRDTLVQCLIIDQWVRNK